jgi:hypothetical protein
LIYNKKDYSGQAVLKMVLMKGCSRRSVIEGLSSGGYLKASVKKSLHTSEISFAIGGASIDSCYNTILLYAKNYLQK